jgi:hypothetical protein
MDEVNPLFLPDEEAAKFLAPRQQPIAAPSVKDSRSTSLPQDNSNPLFLPDEEASRFLSGSSAPAPSIVRAAGQPSAFPPNQVGREEPKETSFSDVISAWPQTVGPSAKAFGESLIEPFTHPKETAQAIGQMGTGIYSKARGALGYTQKEEDKAKDEAVLDQMGEYLKGRYGTKEAVMRTMKEDPIAFFADLSIPFTGGGSLAARVPGAVGTLGKAATTVGRAIDPLSVAMQAPKIAAEATGKALALPSAIQSGASFKSLKEARDAGAASNPVFWEHYTGKAPPTAAVEAVEGAINQIRKDASADYMKGMKGIDSQRALSYDLVDNALNEAKKSAMAQSSGLPMSEALKNTINKLEQVIAEHKAAPNNPHNIAAFDELKRMLRSYGFDAAGYNPEARRIATMVANSAKETITSKELIPGTKAFKYGAEPEYAKIMEGYGNALDDLGEMKYAFTNAKTTDKKLSNIVKGQAGGKKGELLERLAKINPDIPAMIAGQELSPWFPGGLRGMVTSGSLYGASGALGGLAGLVHPGHIAHIALGSPRIAGGLQYGIGRAGSLPERTYRATQPAIEVGRQAGRAEDVLGPQPQARGGRAHRASGGRLTGVTTAPMLVAAAERAKKGHNNATEPLLNQSDEAITRALAIANQHS